ncbi:helix-turn-helix transcriptional regulator [Streptomyces sp. NPDC000410]|uniref:helix-turn-helix domain-containing protein n=1 Tax=Streptomyces sp. NPDC000410 TaxID=3154254 RepID=UPI003321021B
MPPRKAPTARQARVGTELRKMRERSGQTMAQAAAALGTNSSGLSNIESGRAGVSAERVQTLATNYGEPDAAYVDALRAMAEERVKGWWEDYRGTLPVGAIDLAELEHHAKGLRNVTIIHMPGVLQTEEYAKAVFSEAIPKLAPAELRRRLSHRMRRRDFLDRASPPDCTFIIHEAALRMKFGGPSVTRGQLEHLLEVSERDNVTVRVIPFEAGGFANAGSSVMYVAGPVPQLDTVQLDVANGVAFMDSESQLANHRHIIDGTEQKSLPPQESRDFIHAMIEQL